VNSLTDENTRLRISINNAAETVALYLRSLRELLARYDEVVGGNKAAWTVEDHRKVEAIRALTIFPT
jgi:hypothetical protein